MASDESPASEAPPRGERTRRLFFALWPDDAMQAALAHASRKVVRASGGRPVPARNLHLTLAFLGSVAESRLPDLARIARQVAGSFRPGPDGLRVTLDRVEHWPRPQIVCATASVEPPSAAELAAVLKRQLSNAGFASDLKPFHPHVTLVRKVPRWTRELSVSPVTWTFGSFSLIDSRTDPAGSLYSVIDSWPLDTAKVP